MAHRDFRAFLLELEKRGELFRIKEQVDWDEEIGAIYQELIVRRGPAPLFENIKGYSKAHGRKISMLTDGNLKCCCIALDVNENTSRAELVNLWRSRSKQLIKPAVVSSGPCKEVIHKGKDVNLWEFPVPKPHPKDGGRYILAWHIVVTKDPETGWVNVGTYRGMAIDKNSIGMNYNTQTHWSIHGAKYQSMGKPMPMAAAIGVELPLMFCSTTPQPLGVCEYDNDPHKVFLAIGNRAQGAKSIHILRDTPGADLDPACHPDVKKKLGGTAHNDRVLIDATWPWEWEPREEWGGLRYPPPCRASKEMIEKVKVNWEKYGLPD